MSGLLVVGCLNEVNMLRSVVATVIVILYFCTLLSANGEEEDILQGILLSQPKIEPALMFFAVKRKN